MAETIQHPHLAPFRLLKTKPGTCPECGVKHDVTHPHNQQSLAYQYDFYGKHGRWPTWTDAMSHCSDEMKALWTEALKAKGVEIEATN